jgi:hypothetical protein
VSSDRALGSLSNERARVLFGVNFQNTSGQTLSRLDISYWGEEWRLGSNRGRSDRLNFQISLDATSLTTGNWIDFDALDFVTPNSYGHPGRRDGNDPQNRTLVAGAIRLDIPDGTRFWIRWNDYNARGRDDGLAVDDFCLVAVPEPATWLGGLVAMGILWSHVWGRRRISSSSRTEFPA